MPSFNEVVSRSNANALIPQPMANEIIKMLPIYSAALTLCRKVNMGSKTERMPVMSALPIASFTTGDTGMAQTTHAEWGNKTLVAEKVKTIVPIPKDVLDDSGFPLWDEIKPLLAEAVGVALDKACLFGVGKPATWTDTNGIVPDAIAAGNFIARGANTKANGGIYKDLIDLMFKVRTDGFPVTGYAANDLFEQYLLGSFDANGRPLVDLSGSAGSKLLGRDVSFSQPATWPSGLSAAEIIAGDFKKAIIGIRQDIGFTMIKEGVITNDAVPPQIIYNLPQQGMIALLVEARFAFTVANPVTREQATEASRYPFGVLTSPAA